MNFRSKHIADSVVERIRAISEVAGTDKPLPVSRGAATIHMERDVNGDLLVTKTFEHGEPEILTISNAGSADDTQPPEGLVQIGEGEQDQDAAITDQGGIVENAALGGDAIQVLLQNRQG